MKPTLSSIVERIQGFFAFFSRSSKKMVLQVDQYVDEQIEERYTSLKTGKPREDRKMRERIKFFSGIIFLGCILLLLAAPIIHLTSAIKGKIVEATIKSPDEMVSNLTGYKQDYYSELQMFSGVYIFDVPAESAGGCRRDNRVDFIITSDDGVILDNTTAV